MSQAFISEVTAVSTPEILREYKENGKSKVKFVACLQTFGDVNANKRVYLENDLKEALEMVKPRVANRSFLGELDHPPEVDNQARQVVVMLSKASHVITKLWLSRNEVMCEGETLTTPNGKILFELIKDRIPVGFSLRAIGNVESKGEVSIVKKPIFIICYDTVSRPSHNKAVLKEVINESVMCVGDLCWKTKIEDSSLHDFLYYESLKEAWRACRRW